MMVRGLRGANSVAENTADAILLATHQLLEAMVQANNIQADQIASVFFTVTTDLNAEFPAQAARRLGWNFVPLLCATEIPVTGSLPRVVRVLMQINTDLKPEELHHIYLGEAVRLRPDLK